MTILFNTTYCNNNVGIILGDRQRLKVVFTDPERSDDSFSYHYGSNGEMDVATEFVLSLLEKSSKAC